MTISLQTFFQRKPALRRPRLFGGLAAALLCLAAPQAWAWNGTGHMTVARIAYDHLTPKTRASVNTLLARHKDYGRWMSQMPAGNTDRARYAFMAAATWPDDVRRTPDDRPIWHYVDLPVIAPGYTPDPAAILPVKPNAETQIPIEAALLSDTKAADGERAIALCWVEHLVGDIHQPLHDSSLFSPLFPKGDKGGNSDLLAASAVDGDPVETAAHPHNLHALWDDLLGTAHDPAEIGKIAARLEGPMFARKTYPQIGTDKTVPTWVVEGNKLAWDVVYLGAKLPSTPNGDRADVTLPPGYLNIAHAVADRQVALAGLRLADLLNATRFPAVTAPPTPVLPTDRPFTSPFPASAPNASPATSAAASATPGTMPTTDSAPTAAQGQIIGNKNSHVYHLPGDTGLLPAEENRVYFPTEDAAIKAGYHKAGGAG